MVRDAGQRGWPGGLAQSMARYTNGEGYVEVGALAVDGGDRDRKRRD